MGEGLIERVRRLVSDQLGVDPKEMQPEANILEDLGADSLDVVELVMAMEETFDIEISDEEAEAMRTVSDVEQYITARVPA
ncbi:MAG: acyl carrier protein [Myxococcota bacterium]|jgi:acyl carrier protein|nr:acyl carrier protein [Myxococcota bacterium]